MPSGAGTPLLLEAEAGPNNAKTKNNGTSTSTSKKLAVTYDSDIEPDELVPRYVDAKTKLFELQRPLQDIPGGKGQKSGPQKNGSKISEPQPDNTDIGLVLAKIDRIEKDVLFDKSLAEARWTVKRIHLEKDYAAARKQKAEEEQQMLKEAEKETMENAEPSNCDDNDVNLEAERLAAEVLAQDSDDDGPNMADLFASLPVSEVDPTTGKSNTVINGADGIKVMIRNFGKWTGVSPMRVLEEACRARCVLHFPLFPNSADVSMKGLLGQDILQACL